MVGRNDSIDCCNANVNNVSSRLPSHPACQATFPTTSDFNCYLRGLNTIQSKFELLFSFFNISFSSFLNFLNWTLPWLFMYFFDCNLYFCFFYQFQYFFGNRHKSFFHNNFCFVLLGCIKNSFFCFNFLCIIVKLLCVIL